MHFLLNGTVTVFTLWQINNAALLFSHCYKSILVTHSTAKGYNYVWSPDKIIKYFIQTVRIHIRKWMV